jgi:hypothetical protein
VTARGWRARCGGDRLGALALTAGAVFWPHAASACGSCFLESELTRQAYYGTTILMIAVPLLVAASIGGWLYRAARRRALETPARD